MGTISGRKRADGSTGYTAQIRITKAGRLVHQEAQTFDRRQAAVVWLRKREAALDEPGAIERVRMPDPTLKGVIGRYIDESTKVVGRTKEQVLRTIQASELGALPCSRIGSAELVAFGQSLGVQPQTVANYLSHLASVFAIARPA